MSLVETLVDVLPSRDQEIAAFVEHLKTLDDTYYNGAATVEDWQYDAIKDTLRALDPNNAYLQKVGADVRTGKEPLPVPMGSLDQLYDDNDLRLWLDKYQMWGKPVVITEKLDGYSCLLVYVDGRLTNAFSRGNGTEGASVIRHVKHMDAPKIIQGATGTQYIRGEVIMLPAVFNEKYKGQFQNPRNMVAGAMNRTVTEQSVLRDLTFIAHEWVNSTQSKSDSYQTLHEHGFLIPNHSISNASELGDSGQERLYQLIRTWKKSGSFELDGIVVTIDDLASVFKVSKSSSLNPEHSFKFKLPNDGVATEVVRVHWEVSKNFLIKPRIEIKPVAMGGVTITFATGFNAKFIVDNNIGPGAQVLITRQGDVIPYVKTVIKGTQPDLPALDYSWNDTQVEIVLNNKNSPEVIFKQVLDFFVSLEVELLKEANLRALFDAFKLDGRDYTSILGVIFDLTEIEFEKCIGSNGKKIYNSLHRRLQTTTLPILMGSLNYCGAGFGIRKATLLLGQTTLEAIQSPADIAQLNGFDDKTARNIFEGIEKFQQFLKSYGDYIAFKQEEPKEDKLGALVVVMTGFRDKDLHAKIESLGGKVGSSVSGKTTHLLTLDPNNLTGKTKAAKEKGITIMSPDQFKDAFGL
jgi:DNA ligase (NAD+)